VPEEPQEGDMFYFNPEPRKAPKEDDAIQSDLDRMMASLQAL